MAAQSEREPGVVDMEGGLLDPMAQGEEVEQEMLVVEEEQFFPPQMDPEPEMGAAAAEAAVYDTSPPLPHQNPPPIPAKTVHLSAPDIAQVFAMLAGMNAKMDTNAQETREIKNNMEANIQTMREEMQCMGAGLQKGLEGQNATGAV